MAAEQAQAQFAWTDATAHYQHCLDLLDAAGEEIETDEAELPLLEEALAALLQQDDRDPYLEARLRAEFGYDVRGRLAESGAEHEAIVAHLVAEHGFTDVRATLLYQRGLKRRMSERGAVRDIARGSTHPPGSGACRAGDQILPPGDRHLLVRR